jgi:hypothetical protein
MPVKHGPGASRMATRNRYSFLTSTTSNISFPST